MDGQIQVVDIVGHDVAFGYIGTDGKLSRRVIHVEKMGTSFSGHSIIRGFELAKGQYRSFRLDKLQTPLEFVS